MENVSLWIKNVTVFNSYLKKFIKADVSVKDGRFYYIDTKQETAFAAEQVLDMEGFYMLPGLIDIHMHIESSMMTPGPFGNCLASLGVTTIVSEPHEMANVKGIRGILEMIQAAQSAPIDIYYGIPSSVPSTNSSLETTGGIIDFEEMKHLLQEKDVVCVGEIMNYRQIIQDGNDLEITRFLEYLRKERPGYVIEGHCPSLLDLELQKFLYLGINGDHTEHTLEEVKQRMENGMFMELQDKMLKPDILSYIRENHLYEHCSFVTDDTMADVLCEKGQLNYVVEKAVEMGFPLEEAVYCATYTPARRMQLFDRGVIAPGKTADFFLVKDPHILRPEQVYKNGACIYRNGQDTRIAKAYSFPDDFYHSLALPEVTEQTFSVPVPEHLRGRDTVTVRVIEVHPDRNHTTEKLIPLPVKDGYLDWMDSGLMLAAVLERYGKSGHIGCGFLTGACHKEGTIAATYFHDHHNLFVAGSRPQDMLLAVRRIAELNGGFLTVKDGIVDAELPLPVCGILSEGSVTETGAALKQVRRSMIRLGYDHYNPIMSFGTLGLPVSPALKITDRGLIDVKKGCVVPLFVE